MITFDDKLKDYMLKKGYCAIVVDVVDSKTCCAGYAEIVATFATPKQVDAIEGKIRKRIATPNGDILLLACVDVDENVSLSLKRFLGLPNIEVKGIHAFSLR